MVQTWFVWHETWHTTLFGKYYCVGMLRIENNCHMLDIARYVTFLRILKRFSHFLEQSSTTLVCLARNMAHYLVYIAVLKWLESKTTVMYFILRAKLLFFKVL